MAGLLGVHKATDELLVREDRDRGCVGGRLVEERRAVRCRGRGTTCGGNEVGILLAEAQDVARLGDGDRLSGAVKRPACVGGARLVQGELAVGRLEAIDEVLQRCCGEGQGEAF